jgi:hypothetical protein
LLWKRQRDTELLWLVHAGLQVLFSVLFIQGLWGFQTCMPTHRSARHHEFAMADFSRRIFCQLPKGCAEPGRGTRGPFPRPDLHAGERHRGQGWSRLAVVPILRPAVRPRLEETDHDQAQQVGSKPS